jgi:HTH-type transcriptional regulator, transcriptional repressor of NAD biosynthesis genes
MAKRSQNQCGVIIGKFMPFHKGHEFLITTARKQVQHLTVLVCTIKSEPLDGWLRYAWVKETFPDLDVRHVTDENPQFPHEHRFFWEIWRNTIQKNTPSNLDTLFTSELYGEKLAETLGIKHVLVDLERKNVPISATIIRQNPQQHWEFLPEAVRPYYIKRVVLLGPESCGKSYLSEYLAKHFQTNFVEEYARTYCEKFGTKLTELDFAQFAGGQLYMEDTAAKHSNKVLFCDTDLIVTQIWSEIFFAGKCQPWIVQMTHLRRYDLFLLLSPDIAWVDDGMREYAHTRAQQFERLRQELESRNLNYVIIKGEFEKRNQQAIAAVKALMNG